jgi:hypothetical protein
VLLTRPSDARPQRPCPTHERHLLPIVDRREAVARSLALVARPHFPVTVWREGCNAEIDRTVAVEVGPAMPPGDSSRMLSW